MKAKRYLIMGLCLCLFLLGACTAAPQSYQGQNSLTTGGGGLDAYLTPDGNGIMGGAPASDNGITPTPVQLCPKGAAPDIARADNIKSQLAGLKEIKDVSVVVIGNSCLVGYTPTGASTDPTATKNLVAGKCKQADGSLGGVTCGDTPDIRDQIAQMFSDSLGYIPSGDISSRFNDLVKMINPSLR